MFLSIITTISFALLGHLVIGGPVKVSQDITPQIVGGVEAPINYAPHMMALVFGTNIVNFMCGASIVTECHVLTAAHCIDALMGDVNTLLPSLRGVYGSNEWRSTEKNATFKGYINHEKWNIFILKNDIGVLFLSEKLSRSDKWNIIPLEYDWVEAGEKSYVTGWGTLWAWGPHPPKLQLLYVETIGEEECAQGVAKASAEDYGNHYVDQNLEICTMHEKGNGFGMCFGDSGSALVSLSSGKQIGIVSWGFPCALGAPDMFVRVSGFKDFLKDILKDCDKCAEKNE
ncbi:hypothetical protein ABMA28_003877 [Loxostege sticticalis]|uniref:Peptidase S1 domain-containing protein n=1 Tax=Loxostege sticticalis TaxID=481309 RepID=A0ABD0SUD3_LOXSC